MTQPFYFTIVDMAIVILGPRIWRRSNIITITLRWPETSRMKNNLIVSLHCTYSVCFGHRNCWYWVTNFSLNMLKRLVSWVILHYLFDTFRGPSPSISSTIVLLNFLVLLLCFQDIFTLFCQVPPAQYFNSALCDYKGFFDYGRQESLSVAAPCILIRYQLRSMGQGAGTQYWRVAQSYFGQEQEKYYNNIIILTSVWSSSCTNNIICASSGLFCCSLYCLCSYIFTDSRIFLIFFVSLNVGLDTTENCKAGFLFTAKICGTCLQWVIFYNDSDSALSVHVVVLQREWVGVQVWTGSLMRHW